MYKPMQLAGDAMIENLVSIPRPTQPSLPHRLLHWLEQS